MSNVCQYTIHSPSCPSRDDLMSDQSDTRVVQVQPGGDLAIGHNEDVPHPGGVECHRPQ